MLKKMEWRVMAAAAAVCAVSSAAVILAQGAPVVFTATATVKSPTASASAPVTIRIERFTTDAEREKLVGPVKANDPAATRTQLAAMDDIGYIQLGDRRTPLKYAYARATGAGRIVTVVTAQPILHLGGNAPNAKPKKGFDLGLALLVLDASDKGDGELAPAVTLKVNESGAIVTNDYGSEAVRLVGITKGS